MNTALEGKIKMAYFKYGPAYAAAELANQILDWTVGTGANGGVVGLSGGIDSTTTAYLCKFAFDNYNRENQGKQQLKLLGLIMPSKANNPKDEEDAFWVADALGIERKIVQIQPIADAYIRQLPDALQKEYDRGNLYSEIRATVLSRYGAANNLRIMGTGNRDEDYVLGYCTKRGDAAVDNNILGNLPKRLVRELAAYLGVPERLVKRTPTAGLWAGQTDEGELGYNYDTAEIIQNGYEEGKNADEILAITGFDKRIIDDVAYRHRTTEHKRQLPPVGKATFEYK